jgi:hypothetical protein
MSMPERARRLPTCVSGSRFVLPVIWFAYGAVLLVLQIHAGRWIGGAVSMAIMVLLAALLTLGGRSETIRGLRGDGRDERMALIELRASAFSGAVLGAAIVVAFMIELGRGHDGSPYIYFAGAAFLAYTSAILYQRFRS